MEAREVETIKRKENEETQEIERMQSTAASMARNGDEGHTAATSGILQPSATAAGDPGVLNFRSLSFVFRCFFFLFLTVFYGTNPCFSQDFCDYGFYLGTLLEDFFEFRGLFLHFFDVFFRF